VLAAIAAAAAAVSLTWYVTRQQRAARARLTEARATRSRQWLAARGLDHASRRPGGGSRSLPRCPVCGTVLDDVAALRAHHAVAHPPDASMPETGWRGGEDGGP